MSNLQEYNRTLILLSKMWNKPLFERGLVPLIKSYIFGCACSDGKCDCRIMYSVHKGKKYISLRETLKITETAYLSGIVKKNKENKENKELEKPIGLIHVNIIEKNNASGFYINANGVSGNILNNIELLPFPLFCCISIHPKKINDELPSSITIEYNVLYAQSSENIEHFIFNMNGVPWIFSNGVILPLFAEKLPENLKQEKLEAFKCTISQRIN